MAETTEVRTHDFTGTMGVECCISVVSDGGNEIALYGWTDKPLHEGDAILLAHRDDRTQTTRYRLTEVRRPGDPRDMWFGRATFYPRDAAAPPEDDTNG